MSVYPADTAEHALCVREMLGEYLEAVCEALSSELGTAIEYKPFLDKDMANLERFTPPHGCLLLAAEDGQVLGMAGLQRIAPGVAEVTRMYVRPEWRRKGIARTMLEVLLERARAAGYGSVRLDTHRGWAAHLLYRSAGFVEIERYPESEIPEGLGPGAVYMERIL